MDKEMESQMEVVFRWEVYRGMQRPHEFFISF